MAGDFRAFADMEHAGWSDAARASHYVGLFAAAADQARESLLAAVDARSGLSVLDLCCGQGNLAEALVERGCRVVGADFSPAMLALARERVPRATFIEADAQRLPFAAGEFDAVISNFGICHIPDQPQALREVHRVLRPKGAFAMTVWCGPDLSPCFEMMYSAIREHGSPLATAPQAPDFHQFAKRETAMPLLQEAGFSGIERSIVDSAWELDAPEQLFDIYEKGTVRAAMLLASQPPDKRAAIRSALIQAVRERFAAGERWRVPVPAALLRASA